MDIYILIANSCPGGMNTHRETSCMRVTPSSNCVPRVFYSDLCLGVVMHPVGERFLNYLRFGSVVLRAPRRSNRFAEVSLNWWECLLLRAILDRRKVVEVGEGGGGEGASVILGLRWGFTV